MSDIASPLTALPPDSPLPDIPYLKFGEAVTLTNCDREPIHIPGHAQAHGVILAFDYHADQIPLVQVSANVSTFCPFDSEAILGKTAAELFNADQIALLRDALSDDRLRANPLYLFTGALSGSPTLFHVSAHTYQNTLVVELEPADPPANRVAADDTPRAPQTDAQTMLRQALSRLRAADTLTAYCQAVCEGVQRISGFDRVMVYKFHPDGHGEVIAEVVGKNDLREPYLGLHYPESDIPKQARALFVLNTLRLMPDAHYTPAPLVPTLNPLTAKPLDMTYCVLRGYSRMYTDYLINMGAQASMSLAIVKNGELWGLVACHHQTFRWVPYDVRTACEFLSDVVSLQIGDKERGDQAGTRERVNDIHRRLLESMALHGTLKEGLTQGTSVASGTLDLVGASGCAIVSESEIHLLGQTPGSEAVRALAQWLYQMHGNGTEPLWTTDALPTAYPPATDFRERAAGLFALRVSSAPPFGDWVLWFRPEVTQTVNWGGNPNKAFEVGVEETLTPRKSFALWREIVQGKSLPWTAGEIEAVRQLRIAITEIVLRRAGELARLNIELARSNEELDSFAYVASHDLKEPLRGINNYVRFLREDHGDELSAEADEKLDTLVRLTRRMDNLLDSLLYFSRLGRQELPMSDTDLNVVLDEALEALAPRFRLAGMEVRIPRPLPPHIFCNAIQAGELFTNLLSNAAKYSDRPVGEKWVEIGWQNDAARPHRPLVFYVRDNGIGIAEKHHSTVFRIFRRLHGRNEYSGGSGAGLTIAQKIVERHGGRIWLESTVGEGTTFYFTLAPEPKE